ncbi:thioesterase [Virgisporangium aliadipatigenens]|uniref:Thioesterase n=1 Tax=Virgisporangium aliadipatigenens TaxID=741659 RepID=A0A8J3YVC6_9ACTN|nr:hotdog domain-containing protein [Virgisporangium aliadipatigenens]GIJ50481.1 thioesterase [Virgisporangium aliadipatigenens]
MTDTVTAAPRASYGFAASAYVHFDDLDQFGMLHNTRHAVLVERAIVAWWGERGVSFADGRPSSPDAFSAVRDFAITYHAPIRGTGEIAVHFWIERLGRTSLEYRFRLTSLDRATLYAEGRRLAVRLDPATLAPTAWTDRGREIAAALTAPGRRAEDSA